MRTAYIRSTILAPDSLVQPHHNPVPARWFSRARRPRPTPGVYLSLGVKHSQIFKQRRATPEC